MPEFKKDPATIIAGSVVLIVLGALLAGKVITWTQFIAALGLLLTPSMFGRKPEDGVSQ